MLPPFSGFFNLNFCKENKGKFTNVKSNNTTEDNMLLKVLIEIGYTVSGAKGFITRNKIENVNDEVEISCALNKIISGNSKFKIGALAYLKKQQ